jgi:hypothetical protein
LTKRVHRHCDSRFVEANEPQQHPKL